MEMFWEFDGWELQDKHLKQMQSSPFVRPFPALKIEPGLFVLRGPRQVGKSTWLKTILAAKSNRKTCFYLSCENVRDQIDLSEILKSVRDRQIIL
ncbi:MAG TPA: AAA family ATPase [Pseudobdellovibrionaceae bacterium]|jgi:predicted AAA+ superfamily ATPase